MIPFNPGLAVFTVNDDDGYLQALLVLVVEAAADWLQASITYRHGGGPSNLTSFVLSIIA